MSCIRTYTGKKIDPLQAKPEELDLLDIAHALSMLCRAGGHFPHFYSVAQHSLNCMKEARARGYSERVQLGCLLHDGSEAYLADITRPVKAALPSYKDYEKFLQDQIFDLFISPALSEEERGLIFLVDDALLYHEFLQLMGERLFEEEPPLKSIPDFSLQDFGKVERAFLRAAASSADGETYVGVDWMEGKWLAVALKDGEAEYQSFKKIEDLAKAYAHAKEILIDIPIGLPESGAEASLRPDQAARDYLPTARKSSVFTVPLRPVVYAETIEEIWEKNKALGGKLTPPGVGILPCIRQVDHFLDENPSWRERLVESHPECAFQSLNNGKGLRYKKMSEEGIEERRAILAPHLHSIDCLLADIKPKRRADLLDALCLAVTAQIGYKSINEPIFRDKKGIPMRIVVADL